MKAHSTGSDDVLDITIGAGERQRKKKKNKKRNKKVDVGGSDSLLAKRRVVFKIEKNQVRGKPFCYNFRISLALKSCYP